MRVRGCRSFITICAVSALVLCVPAFLQAAMVIGHRGMGKANKTIPENSLTALVFALAVGADAVEFDVQLTKDGEAVLAHDQKLERLSSGRGCIARTSYAAIEKLRMKDGSGTIHPAERISTLAMALEAVKPFVRDDAPFVADIHIKVYDGLRGDWGGMSGCPKTKYRRLVRKTIEEVRRAGLTGKVLLSAFDERALDYARKLEPAVKLGVLSFFSKRYIVDRAAAKKYDAVVLNWENAGKSIFKYARSAGLLAFMWFSRTDTDRADRFALSRTDGVITDRVQKLAGR